MNDSRGHDQGHSGEQHGQDELQPYSDPYAALGVSRDATLDEIKDAYFQLVRAHPPERDPEQFKVIRAAYDRVRTAERRIETDWLLLQPELPLPAEGAAPAFDLSVHREDLLAAARALSDLEQTDFREDFRPVHIDRSQGSGL
jgi:curved DNA-binding protein CbpA